jgi:phosphoadenosine phosphosulfate reductase
MDIEALNQKYKALSPAARIESLYCDFNKVLLTSSFGTTSALLLHLFNSLKPEQLVYFIDTTYHFQETLEYKKKLTDLMQLKVIDVKAEEWKNQFTKDDQTWSKNPDFCCSINKVEPINEVKKGQEIWVSGLLGYQNEHRKQLDIFEQKQDIIKFYPVIDMSKEAVEGYIAQHKLPQHPLLKQGYESVGCTHCTQKGQGRVGRWGDSAKTECGLHL